MGKYFMNLDDGDIGFADGEFGFNSKGEPLLRIDENMVTNMNTGEVHYVDSWDDDYAENPDDPMLFSFLA